MSVFWEALWFGGQGLVVGLTGVLFVSRSGVLLRSTLIAVASALGVAAVAWVCISGLSIVVGWEAWLRPALHVALLTAWFGTMAVVSPEPEKPRIEGPVGPASRAFDAYKQRPSGWAPPEHDRW